MYSDPLSKSILGHFRKKNQPISSVLSVHNGSNYMLHTENDSSENRNSLLTWTFKVMSKWVPIEYPPSICLEFFCRITYISDFLDQVRVFFYLQSDSCRGYFRNWEQHAEDTKKAVFFATKKLKRTPHIWPPLCS